ncbi:MAG: class I SAM-dependent methyltransferase [Planctomycetota bacterium]|nr:class I SAM-dependent methyltransferase [Planctomycetota bacterium]
MALKRVLETEYMDTESEAVDYDSMDHSQVNRVFVEDLLRIPGVAGDVLDLGTGTAQIPIELCRSSENVRVLATDMAVNMLDLARYNIEAEGFIDRIELVQADAKQLDFEEGFFDVVMSNSIVHHIPEPMNCLREAVRVVKPGGILFVRDLMRPDSEKMVNELVQTYAGDENDHQRQMFDDSLRAALSLVEIQELVGDLGFERSTVEATSDRHWTWQAQKN